MPLTAAAVKARAAELGFDLCGIAAAASYRELVFFDEWLARGYAGEMHYLARSAERRRDVRQVMPSARSVIVTATSYNAPRPYSTSLADGRTARISRYAWGDDYHEVIGRRLDELIAWMRAVHPEPFEARGYVDTGPVQERVYAQHAGLGWIGKNTCLISAKRGSWFFLSAIICSLPLEPDQPATDHCGTCTRCLDACPTGALVEPYVLDARRCLSYLTIELRGDIPEEFREPASTHVYGCDICQDVCPWNRAPLVTHEAPWQPRPPLDAPAIVTLWRKEDAELRADLKGSPMKRAKITGLRRNLAVALGNSTDPEACAALDEPAGEGRPSIEDPMVARHVAWARARR
ncbi:MAG TPA: tRNA epoxyqueuosine(34) reductase QueG [Vicinamibacterales bacterium]